MASWYDFAFCDVTAIEEQRVRQTSDKPEVLLLWTDEAERVTGVNHSWRDLQPQSNHVTEICPLDWSYR